MTGTQYLKKLRKSKKKWLENIDIVIEVRGDIDVQKKKDEVIIKAYGPTTARVVPRGKVKPLQKIKEEIE